MILKDLMHAVRSISRNKKLAFINIFGLSIGISGCLIIYIIVSFELSFDKFQPDREKIFRVYSTFTGAFSGTNRGISSGFANAISEGFTGVEAATNFFTFSAPVEVPQGNAAPFDFGSSAKIVIADPNYFSVFRYYDWIAGDRIHSLSEPFQVVLTESRARTYFGDVDIHTVIGRELHYQDSLVVHVSGVVRDVRLRTDIDFTDFISASTIERSWLRDRFVPDDWESTNSNSQLFLRLANGATRQHIEAQIPGLMAASQERVSNPAWTATPTLQPLSDLHFNSDLGIFDGSRAAADKSKLGTLGFVAALLLLMATFNFVSLETAQASRRCREVGVRKVLGSSRSRLIARFLSESFLLSVGAVLLAVVIAQVVMPALDEFIPEGLVINPVDGSTLSFMIIVVIVLTLLAGLYPAFVMSSFRPVAALKNVMGNNPALTRTATVRKGLTIIQFSTSQALILATLIIGTQLDFMLNKDLGFTADAVLQVPAPGEEPLEKRGPFRNEVSTISGIESVTIQGAPPTSGGFSSSVMEYNRGDEKLEHNVFIKYADTTYLDVYGIQLLAGRNLLPVDSAHEYLINETYMRALGFTSPREALGIIVNGDFVVVGVVKDFHSATLHSRIKPMAIKFTDTAPSFGIRMATNDKNLHNIESILAQLQERWQKIYPEKEFHYSFLSDDLKRLYESELRIAKLAGLATVIAILISCLGLFGLSSFTVLQRTKEIGIRKVLGATVNNILALLSRDFLVLVAIAFCLSTPVAYVLADGWLDRFAYRIELGVWIFLASGVLSVLLAFVTISFRTVHAAKADPVKSLRYE